MICTHCKQPIYSGQYRYYWTDDAFNSQHRACSEQDQAWEKMDMQMDKNIADQRIKLSAYKAFRDQWGESVLDDEIEHLTRFIESSAPEAAR